MADQAGLDNQFSDGPLRCEQQAGEQVSKQEASKNQVSEEPASGERAKEQQVGHIQVGEQLAGKHRNIDAQKHFSIVPASSTPLPSQTQLKQEQQPDKNNQHHLRQKHQGHSLYRKHTMNPLAQGYQQAVYRQLPQYSPGFQPDAGASPQPGSQAPMQTYYILPQQPIAVISYPYFESRMLPCRADSMPVHLRGSGLFLGQAQSPGFHDAQPNKQYSHQTHTSYSRSKSLSAASPVVSGSYFSPPFSPRRASLWSAGARHVAYQGKLRPTKRGSLSDRLKTVKGDCHSGR